MLLSASGVVAPLFVYVGHTSSSSTNCDNFASNCYTDLELCKINHISVYCVLIKSLESLMQTDNYSDELNRSFVRWCVGVFLLFLLCSLVGVLPPAAMAGWQVGGMAVSGRC